MTKKTLWLSLPLCMVIAMLAAFLLVSPAFAQDEVPPEVTPTEAPAEVLPVEAPPVEVVPTEAPTELAPVEPAPVEDEAVEEPSLAEDLDEAGVVLADASGTPVTLAARSTGTLALEGDPYFTVGSTTFRWLRNGGTGSCSGVPNCLYSDTPIQAALDFMEINNLTPTDRKLYIQADIYTEDVDVNGSLNGVKGLLEIVGLSSPENVVINGQLLIHNFLSGFSVSNLTVINGLDANGPADTDSAAILAENNSGVVKLTNVNARADGEDSSGIIIEDSGAELNGVNASGNAAHGAMLLPAGTGVVKITNSAFDNNELTVNDGNPQYGLISLGLDLDGNPILEENNRSGLLIKTLGPVTINGISASGNNGDGVFISMGSSVSVKNSVLNENTWSGLFAYKSPLTLENVLASYNGAGIVQNDGVSFVGTYVTTDQNYWDGIYIDTCFEDGGICKNLGTGAVTLIHTGSTNNGTNGLEIFAKGAVTITDGFFGYNGVNGVYVNNAVSSLTPAVTITGVETPGNRAEGAGCTTSVCAGIKVESRGVVALKDFKTSDNTGDGIYIDNRAGTGAVTITAPTGTNYHYSTSVLMNETYNNGGNGYTILSRGAVTATNVDSWNNGALGGSINNSEALSAAAVTINKVGPVSYGNRFFSNGNGEAGDGGLNIQSRGAVNISRLVVENNNGFGVMINNVPAGTLPGVPVTITDAYFGNNRGGEFDTGRNGLEITSRGAVTLTRVDVSQNEGFGATIYNVPSGTLPAAAVTVTDSHFSGNMEWDGPSDEHGLEIISKGLITVTNVVANGNDGYGVSLKNIAGSAGVTIGATTGKGNEFQNNYNDGLHIETNGAVTLTNIFSANNIFVDWSGPEPVVLTNGYGVNIDSGNGAVTIKQVGGWGVENNWAEGNVFNNNADGGLNIVSNGAVNVAFFQTRDNWGTGIYIDADGGSGAVTVSGMPNSWDNLSYNRGDGLSIEAKGLIIVTNLTANSNEGYGAYFNNQVLGATGGVTINSVSGKGNEFQWNLLDGLRILTNGAVTLTNIFASNNLNDNGVDPVTGGYGVYIDKTNGTAAVTFKQAGSWCGNRYCTEGNAFNGNRDGGLWMKTNGVVTVAFYQARDNWGTGIYIDADGGSGAVTVSGTPNWGESLSYNGGSGLYISSLGTITVSKLQAFRNSDWGARLANENGTGSVTLTDAFFDENINNRLPGLTVTSAGTITWKNGTANNNGDYGAFLDNSYGVGKAVSVTNVTASWNIKTGLYILSKGVVTVTDSQADTNSVRYDSISYGDWWTDNLSDGQLWNFSGSNGDKVTIEVNSLRFNPRVYVTDSDGTEIIRGEGVDGSLELNFTLTADDDYQIVVEAANNWNGYKYDIKVYTDIVVEPTSINHVSSANGIYVDNRGGTGGVTISNANGRWNSNNSGTDVVVLSQGVVSLKNLELNDSGEGGLLVDNTKDGVGASGVTLTNVNFNVNDGDAAYIVTEGAVTVNSSNASSNFGRGFYVDNTHESAVSSITFTNVGVDGSSGRDLGLTNPGIFLRSNGAVTFTNVNSDSFGGNGIDIVTKGAVLFNSVSSHWNWGMGTKVVTDGAFTLNAPADRINWFDSNVLDGLHVEAGGKITLTRVDSRDNGWRDGDGNPLSDAYGIYLESTMTGTAPILLTEISSNGNTLDGVRIITKAPVTVNTLSTSGNNGFGLYIDQSTATDSLKPIILNKVFANNNGEDGIYVNAMGSITTNFLTANNNQYTGVNLMNNNSVVVGLTTVYSTGTITMLNTLGQNLVVGNGMTCIYNLAEDRWDCAPNGGVGVNLQSFGAVTVNQLETILNGSEGLVVDNTNTIVKPAVTLNSIISRENNVAGIFARSSGVITINNSWVASNYGDGIRIESNNNVFINNTCSIRNNLAGIRATTAGTPTFKLTNSAWFGNLRDDPDPLDKNLMLVGGWILL